METKTWGDVCRESTSGMTLWKSPQLPTMWAVKDGGGLWWMVPAMHDGWSRKVPYRGWTEFLEPVELSWCYGTGIPV